MRRRCHAFCGGHVPLGIAPIKRVSQDVPFSPSRAAGDGANSQPQRHVSMARVCRCCWIVSCVIHGEVQTAREARLWRHVSRSCLAFAWRCLASWPSACACAHGTVGSAARLQALWFAAMSCNLCGVRASCSFVAGLGFRVSGLGLEPHAQGSPSPTLCYLHMTMASFRSQTCTQCS